MGEEDKTRKKRTCVVELCKEFGENTSMHGISRVISHRSRWKRLIWAVMVACSAGWSVFQFVGLMTEFYTYPVTTVLNLRHETRMKFPLVTICNVNRIRRSMSPNWLIRLMIYLQKIAGMEFHNEINQLFHAINKEERRKAGHQISDMLVDCMFNRKPCSKDNFTSVDATLYGTCHTFMIQDPNLMYTSRAGPQNGLILELDTEHRDHLSFPSMAGVTVIVHGQDEVAYPEEGGILVHPGMATRIGIKKTVIHRLPPPYGTCVDSRGARSAELSLFTDMDYKYTETACRKSCFQYSLYKACNCCDEELPCQDDRLFKMAKVIPKEGQIVPYCNTTDEDDFDCLSELEIKYMKGELNCSEQCPPACNITTFESVVSTALWPSDPYLEIIEHKVNEVLKNMTFQNRSDLKQFIQTNFLRLEIYFQSLDFAEVITKPMYDWNMLLGDIGGQMGLWLGFSVLTAMELIELFVDAVVLCLRRLYRRDMPIDNNINDDKV